MPMMGIAKNLFSRRSYDAEWQEAVIARLDSLAESQNQLRRELAAERPTTRGRRRGIRWLCVMVVLIVVAVSVTLGTSTFNDQASNYLDQAQTATQQVAKDFQPIQNIINKHGYEYIYTHPSKSVLSDLQAAEGPAKQVSEDNAQAKRLILEWTVGQYFGQIIIAVSAAFLGAIAGLLITPILATDRRRRHRR
jgi:predicted PurR-regulated permease PerM